MTTVRRMRWTDALFCWRQANDPTVRQFSLNPGKPTLRDHLRWMKAHVRGPHLGWVMFYNKARIGVLTAKDSPDGPVVGISVDRSHRGRGAARRALAMKSPEIKDHYRSKVIAKIFESNSASIAAFTAAGYEFQYMEPGGICVLTY